MNHWGSIEDINSNAENIDVSDGIEECLKQFSLDENIPQNCRQKVEHIELPPIDPLVMYTIALHTYKRQLQDLIQNVKSKKEIPDEKKCLTMPEIDDFKISVSTHEPCGSKLEEQKIIELPDLNAPVVKQIMAKCVATIFAHIGYETTDQSVLDILVDLLDEFFKKICLQIKIAVEDEEQHLSTGFPNVLERVLTESGFGGVKGIHDFHQSRVVKYAGIVKKRCEALQKNYLNLLDVKNGSPASEIMTDGIKVERETAEENPEVHLLDGEVGCSTLETGYHLLQCLEAELSFS